MITVTYDYTGQNYSCSNYTRTFSSDDQFQNWIRTENPYIWHVATSNQ